MKIVGKIVLIAVISALTLAVLHTVIDIVGKCRRSYIDVD